MKHYQLITAYDDCTCKSEFTDDLQAALGAISVYLHDPNLFIIHLIDNEKEKMIFDWCRD